MNKAKLKLIVFSFLILESTQAFCQIPKIPYRPVSDPFFNRPQSYYNYGRPQVKANKYGPQIFYTVFFKDSTKRISEGLLDDNEIGFYLIVSTSDERKVIRPNETFKLVAHTNSWGDYVAVPADTSWLFKIYQSRVSLYGPVPENEIGKTTHFQVGEGFITPLTKENLFSAIGDKETIAELIRKKKLHKAVLKYNAIVTGKKRNKPILLWGAF
jgi:hypothetical protein